jgi:GWxTD domain-containing protein
MIKKVRTEVRQPDPRRAAVSCSFAVLCLCLLALVTIGHAQDESQQALRTPELAKFYFDALAFGSDDIATSRLDVYLDVPYEALQFTKQGDSFLTVFEAAINITDSTGKQVGEKLWTERVETKDYNESISTRASKMSQRSFLLQPGLYTVAVEVRDTDTRRTYRDRRKIRVRDFSSAPFSISDPMIVNRINTEGDRRVISPNISGNVGDLAEGFNIFIELYNHVLADSARVVVAVQNMKGDVVQRDTSMQPLDGVRKSSFPKIHSGQLIAGDYVMDVTATPFGHSVDNVKRDLSASVSRVFMIRWRGIPVSIVDLDRAIDQMQYIADKKVLDEMKRAPADQKRELWQQFWKVKDPTPSTERNELMEEYYTRVAYANKNFSHYLEGWKTDMGMVYIIFGTPNNIERHPFDVDAKPYEIWTYYEQNREFVFIDATGFGDYRLQTPIWDVWRTRPRR